MKNSILISAWLDACAAMLDRLRSDNPFESTHESALAANRLWRACLSDGWTTRELDTIYARRFNVDVAALRRR
jgi:hypothetical protein